MQTEEVISHFEEAVSHFEEVISHFEEVISHFEEVVLHYSGYAQNTTFRVELKGQVFCGKKCRLNEIDKI